MASRLRDKKEKKLPCISISIEPSIATDFKIYCWNNDLNPTKEIRKCIIRFLVDTRQYRDFSAETQKVIAAYLNSKGEKEAKAKNG